MLILFLILARKSYICLTGDKTNHSDCDNWLPPNTKINLQLFNSTDFSGLDISANEIITLGVGNAPDILIDLSTLHTIVNQTDNVDLIINVTQPDVNDIVTFDFEVPQFDDLKSLTFNNLQLKPNNKTMIHTTSTTRNYSLIFNDVIFLSGYTFDSDIYRPLSPFDFYDPTIVELRDRWADDLNAHVPVFSNFFFCTDYTTVYNQTEITSSITFEHNRVYGKVTIITEYLSYVNFRLNSTEDLPVLGFKIYSDCNNFTFTGGWNENITLSNDGLQVIYGGSDPIYVYSSEKDTHIPLGISLGKHPLYYSSDKTENLLASNDINFASPKNVFINSPSETVTFTSPWNISCETIFTHTDKSASIIFDHIYFTNESASIYRTDIKNKKFITNQITIADNLTINYPGKTDININGNFNVRPGVVLNINSKMRFDKNTAFFRLIWGKDGGFPIVNIKDAESTSIPTIIFTDEEPIENIANANETYDEFLMTSIPIFCGLGLNEVKYQITSPNPSFDENGVWDLFWALNNNGSPTGTNNKTQEMCLWANMTELPEVPIIPVPTASKDPAAVNRNAMIGMIVTFFVLFISAILGFFTKFLKQNKRDREKEKQDELERQMREKELEETESNFDDSEVTEGFNESELSDRYMSFEKDLSINSDDDFSTTINSTNTSGKISRKGTLGVDAMNDSNKRISRKNTLKNNDLLSNENRVETEQMEMIKKKPSKSKVSLADTQGSITNKLTADDVNTPLLNQSDDKS